MPIKINDVADKIASGTMAAPKLNGKFFRPELTGSGRSVGLLCRDANPGFIPSTERSDALGQHIEINSKTTVGYGTNEHTVILAPIDPITERCYTAVSSVAIPAPDPSNSYVVGSARIGMAVQGIYVQRRPSPSGRGNDTTLHTQYRVTIANNTPDASGTVPRMLSVTDGAIGIGEAGVLMTYNPLKDVPDAVRRTIGDVVDTKDLKTWLEDWSVADHVADAARTWSSDRIVDVHKDYIESLVAGSYIKNDLKYLAHQMRYLETYPVSLDAYRELTNLIKKHFPAVTASNLLKQNQNLMMNDVLDTLSRISSQIPARPKGTVPLMDDGRSYSKEQAEAIGTDAALAMVRAPAGSGKTSVLTGCVRYLVSAGVKPDRIRSLSFTNAAAEEMARRNPGIKSTTIARMIMDIYHENFPTHELSTAETVINMLEIQFPNDPVADRLIIHLSQVSKNKPGSYTAMNNFIEAHYDAVMMILNTIGQTTLEIQIMVCFQRIDTLKEPASLRSDYLIVDEVQDTSVFEFIYILEYVAKHKQNLYIVGDASQVLYEFRSANPKALNALESSGVFATYNLTTNYRSNQEILDVANRALIDIEANRIAQIQMRANSLAKPTEATLRDKVTLSYTRVNKLNQAWNDLARVFNSDVRTWTKDKLDKGEKVAFLAYSRRDAATMQGFLAGDPDQGVPPMFPGHEVASLVSEKVYSSTVLSTFVKRYWNDVKQADPRRATFVVKQELAKHADSLVRAKDSQVAYKMVARLINDWDAANRAMVDGWAAEVASGHRTRDSFFESLADSLIDHEVRHNAIRQSLVGERNKENKAKNATSNTDLLVSTIHGVKGLEFDNVVVLYKSDPEMGEDYKRLYYVAFTRAMNSEFILAYGKTPESKIETDYNAVIDAYNHRDAVAAGLIDDDTIEDD